MALFACKRMLARCRRSARRIDHAYNVVSTPITFCELSFEDIPEQIPDRDMLNGILNTACTVPNLQTVYALYDNLSVDKDIAESAVNLYMQLTKFDRMEEKQKVLYLLKWISLIYKTIIVHSPVHEHHTIIINVLDYLNFVVSCW